MGKTEETRAGAGKSATVITRKSDLELVVERIFDAPAELVFRAWSTPDLFKRWWVPKSMGMKLVACEMDVRTGGTYSLTFEHPDFEAPMTFFGTYLEVIPSSRLVWTNEESGDSGVTTVTFEEMEGRTRVVLNDLYPSKEALDAMDEGPIEQFEQLQELLAELRA